MHPRARLFLCPRPLHCHCKLRVCRAGTTRTGQGSCRATRSKPGGQGREGVRDGLTSQALVGHLALGTANCDTGVPTVRAHLGAGMQIVETYPRTPRAMVSCPLRQPEMKMLGCERYTQLRMRAGEPCRPFVASHTEDQTPVDAPTQLHVSWARPRPPSRRSRNNLKERCNYLQ